MASTDLSAMPDQFPSQTLRAVIGGYSAAGSKVRNDDAIAGKVPDGDAQRHFKGIVACIADGLSSARNADRAAQLAVLQFTRDYYDAPESWTVQNCAARLLASLSSWFHSQNRSGNADSEGFATTFTGIVARSTTAHIVHVGDTRCYRLRGGRLALLTEDHTAPYLGGADVLTRALGIDANVRVDYRQEPMRADDLFILTSDGVHGSLSHDAIEDMLGEAAPRDRAELERAASGLCDAALKAGSTDNVSCILVRIEGLPSETLSEAHGRLTRRAIPPVLAIGNRLDDWRVVEVLHSSARSHVYLVEHPDREGRYVLKAPSVNFADDLRYLEGFAVEQWVGRRIRNAQVMQVLPAQDTRFLYFVAEHVEGRTLRHWMNDQPVPACDDILPLVASIVSAVRVFHRMEMVHRDLKPENIIVTRDGTAKIIDFGSVQVAGFADLRSAEIAQWPEGSLNYIAPEVLAGEAAQNLSDLFSIAVICWEMLTGAVPFDREASGKPLISQRERTRSEFARLRPDMSPAVGTVLARTLSSEPCDRQQAMSEFVGELREACSSSLRPTEFVPLIERGSKAMWRNWALIATLVSMVMAVLLFGRFG